METFETMAKTALITGITGQDGAYLAEHLLQEGYLVYGAYRRNSSTNFWRLDELGITSEVKFIPFELLEYSNILRVLEKVQPDEIYNLAAQSFVAHSFEQPLYTAEADALGVTRILEAIRTVNPKIKFYQASTSEMFGKAQETPQSETTAFYPRSPYGVAKLYAHWITVNYRESYDLFGVSGILFNHESPMRGPEFVTRKITIALSKIRAGTQELLELGNLDSKRDWGFAGDYVRGMRLMLESPLPDDYVLATGQTYTVRDFVFRAASAAGFELAWEGANDTSVGIDRKSGKTIVRVNPEFYRPAEVDLLIGDPHKAKSKLGWEPKVALPELVEMMVEADIRRTEKALRLD